MGEIYRYKANARRTRVRFEKNNNTTTTHIHNPNPNYNVPGLIRPLLSSTQVWMTSGWFGFLVPAHAMAVRCGQYRVPVNAWPLLNPSHDT